MLVFVHGAGRRGASAWPSIDRPDAVMLDLGESSSVIEQVAIVVSSISRSAVVVAHSHGAIPAVLALPRIGDRLQALVLVEPALYDVARGNPAIERHIATKEGARETHASNGLQAYWRIVRPLMFGGEFDESRWSEERELARRLSSTPPPWGFGITAADAVRTRTIVVTGGWNDEYEAIGDALAAQGAERRVLRGADHRPQDAPGFAAVLTDALETRRL